jgi:hypothetical protein
MVLESVCPPALLYLAFSIIQIIIDLYRGDSVQAMFKFVVMVIFTIVLNAICKAGMSIISWFIVFIPFILMTYITTILFFVFGVNPGKVSPKEKRCSETMFGCCDDGITTKNDPSGRGCPYNPVPWNNKDDHYYYPRHDERRRRDYPIGGCGGTRYGCCDDMMTSRDNLDGTNCPDYVPHHKKHHKKPHPNPKPIPCEQTKFKCCDDGTRMAKKNKEGNNCLGYIPHPVTTPLTRPTPPVPPVPPAPPAPSATSSSLVN